MKTSTTLSLLAILLFGSLVSAKCQMTDVIQNVSSSGDFEGINATTTVVKVLSYPSGASFLDLSSAQSTGRRLTIVNYASYDIMFSAAVRVDGSLTTLSGGLSKSPNIMDPLKNGVTITILYDGTSWIRL